MIMTKQDIDVELTQIINDLISDGTLSGDYNEINFDWQTDSLFNSLTYIKLLVSLEKAFDIEFEDEDLSYQKYSTLRELRERIYVVVQLDRS
ncbi:phosphopantetheine-binding protein [Paenibacillus sp. FSL H7-0756]|uniref:phosphopantetheine-binding protein n=1 Tax=unclassified Paenibacillus TaxID=185978 RepID=UPI0030FAE374